jgi:hypothetical protein
LIVEVEELRALVTEIVRGSVAGENVGETISRLARESQG